MTVRMDSNLKATFDELCSQFGMSANTAMNVFAKAVVLYRKIPFEIKAPEKDESWQKTDSCPISRLKTLTRKSNWQGKKENKNYDLRSN